MSTIHFVGGEKGGVGKSVVARLLAQLFIDRAQPFTAFDADLSHGALVRYYADYSTPVDLAELGSADRILDSALESERIVLVDLPAQSHRAFKRWSETADLLAYAREVGVRLVLWHVTDGGFDSVTHLEQLLSVPGESPEYVVVKNEGRSKNFSQFDASAAPQRVQDLGGRIVTIPELDSSVMYKIDRFGSSFWAAVNSGAGQNALSPMERRRAKLWLERAQAGLSAALDADRRAPRESVLAPKHEPELTFEQRSESLVLS